MKQEKRNSKKGKGKQENVENFFRKYGNLMSSENKSMNKTSTLPKREDETLKMNQTEVLEVKKSIKEVKNEPASIGSIAEQMKERISDIKVRNLEITQSEKERLEHKKRERTIQELIIPSGRAI